jgi:hypothetical protein
MEDPLDLLSDPGAFAASNVLDQPLPQDNSSIVNLPSLGSLTNALLPTSLLPSSTLDTTMPVYDSNGNIVGYSSPDATGGLTDSQISDLTSSQAAQSGINTGTGSGFGSLFGSLLGTAASDLQNIIAVPAIQQAQLPGQLAAAQLGIAQQQATAQINTSSFTTILIWAAIAYGIVMLIKKA